MGRPESDTDRRHFTAAARVAAAEARRRKQASAVPLDVPEVFVVRSPFPGQYAWEIRRFGAVVLDRCRDEAFPCPDAARAAGLLALASVKAALSAPSLIGP